MKLIMIIRNKPKACSNERIIGFCDGFERAATLVSCVPMPSPIGIIAISAPIVKKPIPIISSAEPARNTNIVPEGIGTKTTLTISTIKVIGSTEPNASIIFSCSTLFTS